MWGEAGRAARVAASTSYRQVAVAEGGLYPKNAKVDLFCEQRCHRELSTRRVKPYFCIWCPRRDLWPEPHRPVRVAGAPGWRKSRGSQRLPSPAAGSEERDIWLCEGCSEVGAGGAAGTNPSALWELPSRAKAALLTRRLMAGAVERAGALARRCSVPGQACSR